MNATLEPLTSFILPSGSITGFNAARRTRGRPSRRARSRRASTRREPLNPQLLAYLNRLSDHLFVAARFVAAGEGGDVLWKPGATRS